ncbi:MAG: aminotransferase class V-fold PLP-dependent enzyme [Bacilli bacterium]
MNRDDFPIFNNNKDLIYFDNGATTLKPQKVIDSMTEYYSNYTANAHRGDYDNSVEVDQKYEGVREKIKTFINADKSAEIVFTSGATNSLNMVVFGFMKNYLKDGDEVLITKSEHASNILPWMELANSVGIKVKFIKLDDNYSITKENLLNAITPKTKVVSLAHITNVIGDIRDLEMIGKICKDKNLLFVVDAAQSIGHIRVDVKKYNIDFLAFSAHKMLGPTGTGVLYGKYELLDKLIPLSYGGGMNSFFESTGEVEYKELPWRLEAGTQNIAGVIGMGQALEYIENIGIENIHKYEVELKEYAVKRFKNVPGLTIYNENTPSGILVFNVEKIFSQDLALYLNHYKICVRSGNHCAKILKEEIKATNTCRASFYFYNTKEEIDKMADVLESRGNIFDIIL